MNAIALTEHPQIGRVADGLEMISVPVMQPSDDEVAIALVASSMHIDEIFAAQGTALGRFFGPKQISYESPYILGSSVSGVVVGRGSKVHRFKLGDEVIVIPDSMGETGSWAQYRCVRQDYVMAKPISLSHQNAAAMTMAACVSWGAIANAKVKSSDRCLVVGASGAIGIMAVQYLKALGCHVTAVCSGANSAFVRRHGADAVIDYNVGSIADQASTAGLIFDAAFDTVGGLEIEHDAFRMLKKTGVFVTVVGPQQYIGERRLSWFSFSKTISHIFTKMLTSRIRGPRYSFAASMPKKTITKAFDFAMKHDVRMPIHRLVPFKSEAVADAVRLLTTHRAKGRLVIDFRASQ